MNVLVFDIETIPDVESGKGLYNLNSLSDKEAAEVMFTRRRQETDGNSDFIRHHLQKIVAISVVLSSADKINVWTLGDTDSSEKEILERFFEGIDKFTPILVSWNGSGFDLPVIHYRSLLHGVSAPRYWETGNDDQSFRWNNYQSRFHERHTDLMDVIAGYQYRSVAPLTEIASMLGFPGKMGMSGDKVWDAYLNGEIDAIRNYCESDVLNTYLVYIRYQLIRGHFTADTYEAECERVKAMLKSEKKPHLTEFLNAWSGRA
jgi:3'-5' exonuclease